LRHSVDTLTAVQCGSWLWWRGSLSRYHDLSVTYTFIYLDFYVMWLDQFMSKCVLVIYWSND